MPRQICKKPMKKLLLVKTMKRKGRNSSFESTFYSPIRDSTGLGITGIARGFSKNLATAKNPKDKEVCRKVLDKMEAEREEILSQLEERDKSILNLNGYVNYGLSIRDNMLKLWKLGNLYQKKRIQNLIFPDGLVYNKETDDIEPISKNEFIFIFDLKSTNCADKKERQTIKMTICLLWYSKRDLNPHSHHWPKDFKSFVSTDSTIRAALDEYMSHQRGAKV